MPLTLIITLQKPPAGASFALQKGSGSNYTSVQLQKAALGEDLQFKLEVDVNTTQGQQPDFKGPFVQGPKQSRFIYIGIGLYAGVHSEQWDRRLKIPLVGITTDMIEKGVLETTVPGTAKDGTPTCATVKPFMGWK